MVGDKLKQFRIERGWSQDDLAKKINVNRVTICRYENNVRDINQNKLKLIADAMGISPADFFIENEKEPTPQDRLLQLIDMLSEDSLDKAIAYLEFLLSNQ